MKIRSSPAGARVFVYRYRYQDELEEIWPNATWIQEAREHRLVPCPVAESAPTILPGTFAWQVLQESPPLKRDDLVLLVNGERVTGDRDASPPMVGQTLEVHRAGESLTLTCPADAQFARTGTALLARSMTEVGVTPLDSHELEPGWYVARVEKVGFEPALLSFHVDYPEDPYHSEGNTNLHVTLQEEGTTLPLFKRVSSEIYPSHGTPGFSMMVREVTQGEYLQFLNDVRTEGRDTDALIPQDEEGNSSVRLRDGGRFELVRHQRSSWPVTGVSQPAAQAYATWYARKLGLPPREFGLPRPAEWTRAGYGGDARTFVFGDQMNPHWVNGRFSRQSADLEPAFSYPRDQTIYGHYDHAGSVSEWGEPNPGEPGPNTTAPVFSGSYWDGHFASFGVRTLRPMDRETRASWIGFRLVRRTLPGEAKRAAR